MSSGDMLLFRERPLAICCLRHTGASSNANQPVLWGEAIVNRSNMWSPSNPGVINIPYTGLYKLGFCLGFSSSYSSANEILVVRKQLTVTDYTDSILSSSHGTGANGTINASTYCVLSAGDFLVLSAGRNMTFRSDHGRFWIYEVGENQPIQPSQTRAISA